MPTTILGWLAVAAVVVLGFVFFEPWLLNPGLRGYRGKDRKHLRRLRKLRAGQSVRVGQEWYEVQSVVVAQSKMFHRRYLLSGGLCLSIRHGFDGYTIELLTERDYTGASPGTVFDLYIQYMGDRYDELVPNRHRVKARIDGKGTEVWLESRRFRGALRGGVLELTWLDGERTSYWVEDMVGISHLKLKD